MWSVKAYKPIMDAFDLRYKVGETYITYADYSNEEYEDFSFGFWGYSLKRAKVMNHNNDVLKLKIRYEDLAQIVREGRMIRCSKIEIMQKL